MINFNQIRMFYEAARSSSFSQAARNLCVTQPAVTGQIRGLEEHLDIKLFKKRGRKMVLTEAGAILFQHTHEMFELEKKMERVMGELRELKRGLLKIGTTKTYARYLMPSVITKFRAAHPDIKIILDEGSSLDVCRSLVELKNELAIVAFTEEVKGVMLLPFREEEVVLFASPRHPLSEKESINFSELAGQLIIMKEEGSSTHHLVRRAFEKRGIAPNVLVETSNVGFIKEMVEKGEGVAFLVRSAIQEELAKGLFKVVPIADENLLMQVHIAHLGEELLSPPALAFLEILKNRSA